MLPKKYVLRGELVRECAYGENPWQVPAGLYSAGSDYPLAAHRFEIVDGRLPSFINMTDGYRLNQTVTHLAAVMDQNFGEVPYMAVAVKHGNPCGAAIGGDPETVLKKMVMGDPVAVFGAVMMTNFHITEELACVVRKYKSRVREPRIFSGVAAPSIDPAAYEMLGRRDGQYVLMVNKTLADLNVDSLDRTPIVRQLSGGDFLIQPNYTHVLDLEKSDVFGRKPTTSQLQDVGMGWAIMVGSSSNTISIVRGGQLLGNGAGQQDRWRCCELAVKKALDSGHKLRGATATSDSFFPYPQGVKVLGEAGIGVLFATSGSKAKGGGDDATRFICSKYNIKLLMQPDPEARTFTNH